METLFCQFCGHRLNADSQFCSQCGKPVVTRQDRSTQSPPVFPSDDAPTQYLSGAGMNTEALDDDESTQPVKTVRSVEIPPPPPPPQVYPGTNLQPPPPVSFAPLPGVAANGQGYANPESRPVIVNNNNSYAPPAQYRKSPRKRNGCLRGCLFTLLGLAVIIGGIFAWLHFFPPWSDNLTAGQEKRIDKLTVKAAGGDVVVENSGSELDGLAISVPEGAYDKRTSFVISERPIEDYDLGPGFTPATPLIHIDAGGQVAAEPLLVTIPVDVAPDEFAMAFYYDPVEGTLEGIPLVEMTSDSITIATTHFSLIAASKIKKSVLESVSVDTGFAPGVDDWQFTNNGSYLEPNGHCAGQAISMMWYYYERKTAAGDPALYGRFDNNDQPGTPAFEFDDSWSYRFASVVQHKLVDWDHISRSFFREMGKTSDYLSWASFVYAMYVTEEPQYVGIYREGGGGHAIVAYKVEKGRIYVADPNYPGITDRYLRFDQDKFQPYYSGADATAIVEEGESEYATIRYFAKSAMSDWEEIGEEYKKMLKGTSGDTDFLTYNLYYLSDVEEITGRAVWTSLPDALEINEEDTAKPGEQYRGKLIVRVDMPNGADFQARLFNGTTRITGSAKGNNTTNIYLELPLTPGVYDLGIQTQAIMPSIEYNDFHRIKLMYERDDLTGTWSGVWRVEDADKIIRFFVEMLAQVVHGMGFTETYDEAEAALWASVEKDPNLYADRPILMVYTPVDPDKRDKYDVQITVWNDDGTQSEFQGDAVYREGVLELKWRPDAGSKMHMDGEFGGENTLQGTYSINAWGIIKDAVTGSWEIQRVDK